MYGTQNALDACIAAGVRRFVHAGTEAALSAGQALVNVDEDAPLRPDSPILYAASKAAAEQRVRAANGDGIETVVIRPRFVWGRGDTTLLPELVKLVESGRFRWIGGGGHLTDTTNVDNTVEGLWLGATKAPAGGVYFVTDGSPVVFREFVTRWLATQGVAPPDKTIPTGVAKAAAAASETAWRLLKRPARRRSRGWPSGSPRRNARSTSRARSASSATGPSSRATRASPRSPPDSGQPAVPAVVSSRSAARLMKKSRKRPTVISSPSSSSASPRARRSPTRRSGCGRPGSGRPPSRWSSACRRDTVGSSKRTWAERLRPMRVQPSWSGTTRTRSPSSKAR